MLSSYVLTAGTREAGILVLAGSRFRFHASHAAFGELERRDFATLAEAAAAAREVVACPAGPPVLSAPRIDITSAG